MDPQADNQPQPPLEKSVFSLRDWVILFSLASVQFVNILDFIIVMPLGPRFFDELGLSAEQFGYVVASYGYASSIAGIVAAGWINRIERRKTLLVVLFLFLISSLACYFSVRFTSLILARCMTGVCGGLIGSMVMSIASDLYSESRRGYAIGVIMTSFSMASVVGVPIGLWLAERDSSARSPFLYLALVCVPIWIVLYSFLPRVPSHEDSSDHGYWGTFWGVLKLPSHRWAFLFTCINIRGEERRIAGGIPAVCLYRRWCVHVCNDAAGRQTIRPIRQAIDLPHRRLLGGRSSRRDHPSTPSIRVALRAGHDNLHGDDIRAHGTRPSDDLKFIATSMAHGFFEH